MIEINYEFKDNNINFTIDEESLLIPYNGDVDLTNFIDKLTRFIDQEKQINLTFEDYSNLSDKEKILDNTIKDIIKKFNKIIQDRDNIEILGG